MDQTEPEDQKLRGFITQYRPDANLDGDVHVSSAGLYQAHELTRLWRTTDTASARTQLVRTP